jgi:hypothetical protein
MATTPDHTPPDQAHPVSAGLAVVAGMGTATGNHLPLRTRNAGGLLVLGLRQSETAFWTGNDSGKEGRTMTHEIDALEGEALAAAVAERVMGWHRDKDETDWMTGRYINSSWAGRYINSSWDGEIELAGPDLERWRPDRDIAQAFEAVDHIAELHSLWAFSLELDGWEQAWHAVWLTEYGDHAFSNDATPATAICRACLKAVGEVQE